ncbi:major facilitator superfamily domain-containing protein [Neohortaea acidophila]|uniref:Major facilitator superfamily domain-containing protein n=1 Tax=Neohortaea acidophila TaxID=245834 RepID=A0A6A6Q517_9PEZI|nr:major facilitator superfamily domain-containing protein [Neohortaea acidophila]KAF2487046.1 major facilitator superfamily domain-containing protein [Neohortaea acidophila]
MSLDDKPSKQSVNAAQPGSPEGLDRKDEQSSKSHDDPTTSLHEQSEHAQPSDNEKKDVEAQVSPAAHAALATEDFSIFTVPQKRAIIVAGSFISWFSPMTGSIYYPALNEIARDLHVSDSKINLTITTYLILQGLAPMMIAGFSDKAGRRPAYFICFTIYIIANLALALQNNYVALLVLRMLQSAGSSGTVALAQGLVGDCIVSSERGKYVAYASIGSLLGPSISPVIGGLLSQYLGWHSIFWFLLILSSVSFVPLVLFLPETSRALVGDGSVPPPWTSANLTDRIRFRNRERKGIPIDEVKLAALRQNYRITFPNPIGTLRVLADRETALLLGGVGIAFACFYAISTGAAKAFHDVYHFDELYISLVFLPIGVGSIISAFTTGRLIDWNYKRHARALNFPIQKNRQTDLTDFPIERARMEIGLPIMLLGAVAVVGYGWLLDAKVSVAGPIIMLFILGYCLIAGSQALITLMVDIYPGKPATATAANNVVRCLLGAAATAAIGPMTNAIGNGWSYTILAVLFMASATGPLVTMKYGVKWRRAKKEKKERRRREREEKGAAGKE